MLGTRWPDLCRMRMRVVCVLLVGANSHGPSLCTSSAKPEEVLEGSGTSRGSGSFERLGMSRNGVQARRISLRVLASCYINCNGLLSDDRPTVINTAA